MNPPKHNSKKNSNTKTWTVLASLLVLGSIAGLTAASGGLDSMANFGPGSSDVNANTNGTDAVDAKLRSDVTDTLRVNGAVQADLTDAIETADKIQAEGHALLESAKELSGEQRVQVEARATDIVSQITETQATLESHLDATKEAGSKLERAVESDSRATVGDEMRATLETHSQAETDLKDVESIVMNIKSDASSLSAELRGEAPVQFQASAQSIVDHSAELESQVQDARDSIENVKIAANATLADSILDANFVATPDGKIAGSASGAGDLQVKP